MRAVRVGCVYQGRGVEVTEVLADEARYRSVGIPAD